MKSEEVYSIIEIVAAFSVTIPIILCLFRIKALNETLWALFIYLCVCLTVEGFGLLLLKSEGASNALYNTFTILESGLICYIYYTLYSSRRGKIIIFSCFLVLLIFAVLTFIVLNKFSEADTIVRTIEAAIIIALSGAFVYKLQIDDNVKEPTKLYSYWINLSFLIYFSGVFMLFMNMDFLRKSTQTTAYIFWGLHQFLNFTTNILISIGVWKLKPKY